MDYFLQLVVSGIVTGGIYALIAMGFVVIYKATGVINFATGELMMLGAFFAYTAMTVAHAAPWWSASCSGRCSDSAPSP